MLLSAVAFLGAALACYLCLRRGAFSVLDPLLITAISIPASAALLAYLYDAGAVGWGAVSVFLLVLTGYLCGARVVLTFFSREEFRNFVRRTVNDIEKRELVVVLLFAALLTGTLAALGLGADASGDARQGFGRAFRPLLLLQNGAFAMSLVVLLSQRISLLFASAWLAALLAMSVPFAGKGVLVPVMMWVGLRIFMVGGRLTFKTLALVGSIVTGGAGFMALLSYGASGGGDAILLLANRVWMSGDVYIYAYQQGALEGIRSNYPVSFLAYMLHPLTSLVGLRAYEKPLGAMLSSEVIKDDVLTGPNPQLPVVLDFFFPDSLAIVPAAFLIGMMVISLRTMLPAFAACRSRFLKIGATAAALFAPGVGFLDTSQVLMTVVSISAVTGLFVGLEMWAANNAPIKADPAQHSQ
jgi:hypothetical protein